MLVLEEKQFIQSQVTFDFEFFLMHCCADTKWFTNNMKFFSYACIQIFDIVNVQKKIRTEIKYYIFNSMYKLKYQESDRTKIWKGIKLFAVQL